MTDNLTLTEGRLLKNMSDGMQVGLLGNVESLSSFIVSKKGCALAPTFFSIKLSVMLTDAHREGALDTKGFVDKNVYLTLSCGYYLGIFVKI